MSGVSCTLQELLEDAMRAHKTLHLRRKSRALHTGAKRSSIRGRGMEFLESRLYVAPDEMRSIDWKVSARLNNLYTKIYIEEKDRPIILVLDFRSHMYFGTKNYFKSVLAAKIASRLAQAAINGGDPVGALFFDDQNMSESKTGTQRKYLAFMLGMLAKYTQKIHENMSFPKAAFWQALLSHTYNKIPRGAACFIVSDFAGFDQSAQALLYRLRKKADVFALSLHDPLEERLPALGLVSMSYADQTISFDSSDNKLQKIYAKNYQELCKTRADIFLNLDIPEIKFSTAHNLDHDLLKLFTGNW